MMDTTVITANELFVEYPKMKTLFKLIPSDARGKKWDATSGEILPETAPLHFMPLDTLVFTEKIDGTNMAIRADGGKVTHIQKKNHVCERGSEDKYYFDVADLIVNGIESSELSDVIIYGELCGPKIQKGGNYFPERKFLVFDIYSLANGRFFTWSAVEHWASMMGLATVPVVTYDNPDLSVFNVRDFVMNLKSAFNTTFDAEGIVIREATDTCAVRRHQAKIRRKDFALPGGHV